MNEESYVVTDVFDVNLVDQLVSTVHLSGVPLGSILGPLLLIMPNRVGMLFGFLYIKSSLMFVQREKNKDSPSFFGFCKELVNFLHVAVW